MSKKQAKSPLPQTTLFWISIFFMVFAVFVVLMYYRQAQDTKDLIKYQEQQREALIRLVAPSPKAVKK